jgi:hypothetical protein
VKTSVILAVAAAGIALALLLRKLRDRSARRVEHRETFPESTAPGAIDTTRKADEAQVDLSVSDDPAVVASSVRNDPYEEFIVADVVGENDAELVALIATDGREGAAASPNVEDDAVSIAADETEWDPGRPVGEVEQGLSATVTESSPNTTPPEMTVVVQPAQSTSDSGAPFPLEPMPKAPRQYRPPRSLPPRPAGRRTPRVESAGLREQRLDIPVRLVFERGGFCRLSLIPQKDEGLEGDIRAVGAAGEIELIPLQENFYSDVFPSDMGMVLRHGLEWTAMSAGGEKLRWSLAGREVYVLGEHEHISGYLSTARVLLGARHVLLCTDSLAERVAEVVSASGSPPPTLIGPAEGLPAGWMGLSGVVPSVAIPQSSEHDILNILRPRPDIAIVLDGGIRIGRSSWLSGYPPQIRVNGDISAGAGILIDGIAAVRTETGSYAVAGIDTVGAHTVCCADQSRTFQIRPGLESWTGWDAYRWSLEGIAANAVSARPSLCGPIVSAPRGAAADPASRMVATRNPVLIGAVPGEIAHANVRGTLRVAEGLAAVPFDPVWALPADSFHCDKRTAHVVALASTAPADQTGIPQIAEEPGLRARRAWCDAILDAARKGLTVEPDEPGRIALWLQYKRRAKALRRQFR